MREQAQPRPQGSSTLDAVSHHILLLNGPNLNLLGTREPEVYGSDTLDDIVADLVGQAEKRGATLRAVQSNHEGDLVDALHEARSWADGVVINPGAFTHYSIALRDALTASRIPFIEVHLSNVHAREPFRRQSHFSDLAVGVITGLGAQGYELALSAAIERLKK